ncbi:MULTISPECIES: hypothetical protein [unclassified Anabaena]
MQITVCNGGYCARSFYASTVPEDRTEVLTKSQHFLAIALE